MPSGAGAACRVSRDLRVGTTSTRATVAAAMSAPEAVDIMAATPAASTIPPSPAGTYCCAIVANASSGEERSGATAAAVIPMTAPATP